jgi:hypothetical protein
MSTALSQDSQVILLLTAPLMTGRMEPSADLLTPGEYGHLAIFLHEHRTRLIADVVTGKPESIDKPAAIDQTDNITEADSDASTGESA